MKDLNISHSQELEVRWGDCDAAGIVYYVKYFDWFTDGRVALLKHINIPYQKSFHEQGITVVVIEATCRYRKNLKSEENFILWTKLARFSRTRMIFDYIITKPDNEQVVAEGRTVHTFVDNAGKPFNIGKNYPELWEKLSALYE